MSTHLGFQYSISEQIFVRAGMLNDSAGDVSFSSLGFGFNFEAISFDLSYLLADEFDPHADMLKFSISGSF